MQSAARLVPSFRQALRPVAGPSRPALARFASTVGDAPAATDGAAVEAELKSEGLPPNVTFEDISGARTQVGNSLLARGQMLHTRPADPFEPIMVPLSSFESLTPTQPGPDGQMVALPASVFAKPLRRDILHRNVVWYLSTLRAGNQSTKNRSTVAYSGRKIRPQKGSGKARAGDRSSGTRRGGAPIHALNPRDWAQDLPRKVRKLGLQTALSSKLNSGLLRVVADLDEAGWAGTRDVVHALGDGIVEGEPAEDGTPNNLFVERFGPKKDLSILFIYSPHRPNDEVEDFWRIIRNIPNVELLSTEDVVAYDVLKYRWVVMEAGAVDALASDEIVYDFDPALDAEFASQLEAAEPPMPIPEVNKVDLDAAAPPPSNPPSA